MAKVKNILLIAALISITALAYLSYETIKGRKAPVQKEASVKTEATAVLDGVDYVKTTKDGAEFRIIAKTAEYFKEGGAKFKEIKADFYTKDGDAYTLSGVSAAYDDKKETVTLKGDVVLRSKEGYELKTGSLFYSHPERVLTTPDEVVIKRDGLTLEGVGMKLDLTNKRLNIMEKVKGRVTGP